MSNYYAHFQGVALFKEQILTFDSVDFGRLISTIIQKHVTFKINFIFNNILKVRVEKQFKFCVVKISEKIVEKIGKQKNGPNMASSTDLTGKISRIPTMPVNSPI